MFLKQTKSKNHTYLQLVESFREGKKTKHKVIANLGRLDKLLEDDSLVTIGRKLLELSGTSALNLEDLKECKRVCYGHIVYEKLWKKLKLEKHLFEVSRSSNHQFDLGQTVFNMVIDRLIRSSSKQEAHRRQDDYYQLPKVELHQLYRSLDLLAASKDDLQQRLFYQGRDLFNLSVDVAFYDVTTFHFESQQQDSLRDFGFSKAGKFNEVQVVMGLFTDKRGRPIGYELFPGNTFDGKTMLDALQLLKNKFQIGKVIIVADKGLNSKQNFHLIREAGFDYIVSAKLKQMSSEVKKVVLDQSDYISECNQDGEVTFQSKSVIVEQEYEHKEEDTNGKVIKSKHKFKDKLVLTWSPKRAHKNEKDRNRLIAKATKMLEEGKLPKNKKGAKKYLKADKVQELSIKNYSIDEERIQKDKQWDGYYGMLCSRHDYSEKQVIEAYHQLWKIEESFRVLKSTMKTRPIYHWTPSRIKGHFVVCFIAFLLERLLEEKLIDKNIPLSPQQIRQALKQMQLSEVEINEHRYYLKGANGEHTSKILRAMNIAPLKNMLPAT